MKFSKTRREKIKKFAQGYYNVHIEHKVDNPYFEYCVKENSHKDWKCNTCDYKEECGRGEQISEENTNVIPELIDGLLNKIEEINEGKK